MMIATADFEFLKNAVAEHSGNVLTERQAATLDYKLLPVAKKHGLNDVQHLIGKLRAAKPAMIADVAEAVTINETMFFRDTRPFDALQQHIIPNLIEQNQSQKRIRIWCAACSAGQEPYSVAMTFREHFPQLMGWDVKIIATDICKNVLRKAEKGEFSQLEVSRGLETKMMARYFDRRGPVWKAKPIIRDMVQFQTLNLAVDRYPGPFDIVLIRNVLIYFNQIQKEEILRQVSLATTTRGYIMLGAAEFVLGLNVPLKQEEHSGTVYFRPTR